MAHVLELGRNVLPPLYISSRLMAALHVENAGTLHLLYEGQDDEGRCQYHYLVEDINHQVLHEGHDLRSGVGGEVNYSAMMDALLSFLLAYAEGYVFESTENSSGDESFDEWCYLNDSELESAKLDLQEDIE